MKRLHTSPAAMSSSSLLGLFGTKKAKLIQHSTRTWRMWTCSSVKLPPPGACHMRYQVSFTRSPTWSRLWPYGSRESGYCSGPKATRRSLVPPNRSSLKEEKYNQMVEKRTKTHQKKPNNQTQPTGRDSTTKVTCA